MAQGNTDGVGAPDDAAPALCVSGVPEPTMARPTRPGWYVINRRHGKVQLVEVVFYPGTTHLMAYSTEMGWLDVSNSFLAWRDEIALPVGAAGWSRARD